MKLFETLIKDRFELILDDELDSAQTKMYNIFLNFCVTHLSLKTKFVCHIVADRAKYGVETLAYYAPDERLVVVYGKNRMTGDVMRSIAHELVHHKQNDEERLNDAGVGNDGSDIENEANAEAGVIMRKFGKKYQEIYS